MNPRLQVSTRLGAAGHGGTVSWKEPPWRFLLLLPSLVLWPALVPAQTIDAVSREVSIFNQGPPPAIVEAISREVSLFNQGLTSPNVEAISREISLFNQGPPPASVEAISREVSLFDQGLASPNVEAISREVSLFDQGLASPNVEAVSREFSLFNQGLASPSVEAISREVSVFDYDFNRVQLTVGSTAVPAGSSGGVPVTFSTVVPVTNVQVAVDFPPNRLTNWSVQPEVPLTGTAYVSNYSRLYLTFSPPSGQSINATQRLGQINFATASNQDWAFLPLPVASVTAPMLQDGSTDTPYKTTQDGEVVVMNERSLLRLSVGADGLEYLTLYGYSGTNYTVESATSLEPPVGWQPVYALTPSNFMASTPGLVTTNPAVFYRARQ